MINYNFTPEEIQEYLDNAYDRMRDEQAEAEFNLWECAGK